MYADAHPGTEWEFDATSDPVLIGASGTDGGHGATKAPVLMGASW